MPSFVERRKHKRVPAKIPAGIYFKNKPDDCIDAEIRDISLGGAFVSCAADLDIGEEVLIEIRFGETQLFEAKVIIANEMTGADLPASIPERVVVKWARGSAHAGFGVAFVDLKPDKKEFLAKLLVYFENLKKSGVSFPSR